MSGGIGPTTKDIAVPSEGSGGDTIAIPEHHPHHRFLSLRQLNTLAVSIVLAASGMVAAGDIIIVFSSLPYIIFLSRYAFPPLHPSQSVEPPIFGAGNRLIAVYVAIGALLGLLLPIAYIFEGIMEGDKEGIKAAVPHVFLLASQVFMEGVTFSHHFSLPIRAFVPISFNALRMFTLIDWVMVELNKEAIAGGEQWSALRLLVGKGLAVANFVFWAFNLFGFLLPVYLPRALKRHYGDKEK
ncbi:uncharacterized protein LOC110030110 [Phalaenopsis equestris]|uniref:uncharacterized protein LOC110030110 n=1 Tax=Phalaenopsis equestris TaxID=78828 RepID=UPI0009E5E095|nr:uncharacterized protein LOC110030110 [Phalaenopsis equestris]